MRFCHFLQVALGAALIVSGLANVPIALAQDASAVFAQAVADARATDDFEAPDRALEAFGKLCESGMVKACANAGVIGAGRFDSSVAMGWMQKACDGGHMASCYYVADRLIYADTPDMAKARALFGKACAQGVVPACLRFGMMLESAEGGPEDLRKAFDVYKRACAAPSAVACERLSNYYRYRDGFEADDATARATLEQACTLNAWAACSSLAEMLRDGQGGPVDEVRASELFSRVCLHGDNMGACDTMLLVIDRQN